MLPWNRYTTWILCDEIPELLDERDPLLLGSFIKAGRNFKGGTHGQGL